LTSRDEIKIGVIADTHIPDRAPDFPAGLLEALRAAEVDLILHAGDVSSWRAVKALEEIAPVTVVQGNRDWLYRMGTPKSASLNIHGRRIVLAHGHRTMLHYLTDKWAYMTRGYIFERYYDHLSADYPEADVVIFGHTHHQTARWVKGHLFFNPGAAYPCGHNDDTPEYGFLSISPDGTIKTACCRLGSQ
jgi:hypothetical protein